MRLAYVFAGLLGIPWAFLVAAADFWWGMAFGYIIVPAVVSSVVWRFSRQGVLP
ncbi:putative membrane protein [Exiguobacterium sp. S17]|nr:putative membrane protein [Exiguobacterium sp. S17]